MISQVIDFSIRNRTLVIFGVLLVGSIGLKALDELPIDAVPDVTNVQVQVLTSAPALGPLEVEQFITFPVEAAMGGLPRLEEVRSISRFGLSVVTVVFEEGTDIYFARQLIQERLAAARDAIPDGYGSPEMGPISTGLGEIYQFEVRGEPMCPQGGEDTPECYTVMELRTLLEWYIAYQLRPIDGVVEINTFGGELKTFEVRVDPGLLNSMDITLADVFEALERNNGNAGGAYVVHGSEQRLIRGESLLTSLDDIRHVVINSDDGVPVTIGDVAEVLNAPMVRQGAVTRDGRGEVVTGIVMMLMGASSGQVASDVHERILELAPTLPEGVTIETFYDRTELVDRTIHTVAKNLTEGGVLVIVVLLLLLGNLRGGLLVASVIPLSMLFSFIAMNYFGVSGNLMSLGAIDFGLIVDGSVVLVENVVRVMAHEGTRGKGTTSAVRRASHEVARPVVFAVGIIMIVYVPILTLQGIEGKMFKPMAITVLFALGSSLILALTWVPAVATLALRKGVSEKDTILIRLAKAVYRPLLYGAMRLRFAVIGAALILLGVSGLFAMQLGAVFVPRLDEGAIAMQTVRLPSVSLEESVRMSTRTEQLLIEEFPDEIDTVISRTGRAEIATDPMGVEISDVFLMLNPPDEWTRAVDQATLVDAMSTVLHREIPGQNYVFSQPIELRTNELISGVRTDVAVYVYGEDLDLLGEIGERIVAILNRVPGSADVNSEQVSGLPYIRIDVDQEAIARYGLAAGDVLEAVSAIGGYEVGEVFQGQRRFPLQVRFEPEARADLGSIRDLLIAAPDGTRVPLGQVATILLEDGPAQISRENVQRRVTISANVRGRDLAGFVAAARRAIAEEAEIPTGYFVQWGGQFEKLQEAAGRLAIAVPVALMAIFLLLFMTYGSARPALIIYLNVPFAASGGILALWSRGLPFSISAAVGFIALFGVAVMNGVVMISYIRQLQAQGVERHAACLEGAMTRLRPVLMTALVASLGFLPMALSRTAGAEVQRPLATVVIGGLITATFLTLLVLPAIYSWLGGEVEGDPIDGSLAAE